MALDLNRLAQKKARLEAALASADTALREARRRDDTRRKVVLGGALLAALRDGTAPDWILSALVGRMQPRDAALFADMARGPVPEFEGAGQ
ncbi:hypothetical protein GCM10011390_39550 [Aureimonas endophytica]|jgi:hypothetical protein|uniref:Relaxasome subunit MobC n=1 Tax=Aureimonas endophytica TaxID=2027858 RepID=A0A917E949_9HYPH|nr:MULTISPECIES: hypothetical protein [Aureimonas]GGE16570.1 hypothetical protein GCM10011390_39550 [Aureimonas endophytica]